MNPFPIHFIDDEGAEHGLKAPNPKLNATNLRPNLDQSSLQPLHLKHSRRSIRMRRIPGVRFGSSGLKDGDRVGSNAAPWIPSFPDFETRSSLRDTFSNGKITLDQEGFEQLRNSVYKLVAMEERRAVLKNEHSEEICNIWKRISQ